MSIRPSTSRNLPRTLLIRCRTEKLTELCAGSIRQIPVGVLAAMVDMLLMVFPVLVLSRDD
jgi:hypothetical protein